MFTKSTYTWFRETKCNENQKPAQQTPATNQRRKRFFEIETIVFSKTILDDFQADELRESNRTVVQKLNEMFKQKVFVAHLLFITLFVCDRRSRGE